MGSLHEDGVFSLRGLRREDGVGSLREDGVGALQFDVAYKKQQA